MTTIDPTSFKTFKFFLATILVYLFASKPAYAIANIKPWQPIFQGIEYSRGSLGDHQSYQIVNAMRVDLTNPHIHFFSTPKSVGLSSPNQTITQTTSRFLEQYKLQVAVNANYFHHSPLLISLPTPLLGLAISDSQLVNPALQGNTTSLAIKQNNSASIVNYRIGSAPTDAYTVVSGIPELLRNGQILPVDNNKIDSRTAAGITQDGKYLILLTIDGRRFAPSDGATLYQTAQWLQKFGAYNGVNLDGGSSSTMVRQGLNGSAQVLNDPKDFGIERPVGNNLGIFAPTLDIAETVTFTTGFIPFAMGVSLLRSAKN